MSIFFALFIFGFNKYLSICLYSKSKFLLLKFFSPVFTKGEIKDKILSLSIALIKIFPKILSVYIVELYILLVSDFFCSTFLEILFVYIVSILLFLINKFLEFFFENFIFSKTKFKKLFEL